MLVVPASDNGNSPAVKSEQLFGSLPGAQTIPGAQSLYTHCSTLVAPVISSVVEPMGHVRAQPLFPLCVPATTSPPGQ